MFPAKFSRGIKLLCTELNLYQVTNQWVEPNVVRLGPTRISSYQPILCAQKNAAIKFDKVYIPALSGRACVAIVLPLFSPFLFANEPIQAKNTTWKGMISNCSDLLSFCSLCSVFAFFFGNKPMSQPWKDRPCNRSYKNSRSVFCAEKFRRSKLNLAVGPRSTKFSNEASILRSKTVAKWGEVEFSSVQRVIKAQSANWIA